MHHAFESPADFTQDAALAEGLRKFLLRGGACSGRKSKKRKKACALWKTEAETLYALYPANRGANPSLERFGRYAELAQILAEQVPAAALRVLREAGCCDDDLSAILLAASVLRSNSFTIMDAVAVGNIGSAVSLRASFFNHECHANAKVRAGAPLSVRAIAPIAEGEEIFISYLGPWRREHERQEDLQKSWGFRAPCDCSRGPQSCPLPLDGRVASIRTDIEDTEAREAELRRMLRRGSEVAAQSFAQARKQAIPPELWHSSSLPLVDDWMKRTEETYEPLEGVDFLPDVYRMLQWFSTAYVQRMDCRTALGYARRAQVVEDAVLPQFWPTKHGTLAVLQHCLADESSNARDPEQAQVVAAARQELMRVLTGDPAEVQYGNWARDALALARALRGQA